MIYGTCRLKRAAERIDGFLRLLSLHGDRHAPISAYSKGMRQKVLLDGGAAAQPGTAAAGRAVLRIGRGYGTGAAQSDSGVGGTGKGGAVQFARAGNGGAGLFACR